MIRPVLLSVALLSASVGNALAQAPPATAAPGPGAALRDPEAGGLLIRNYPPTDYNGGGQNWALLQDARGVIYVGSTNALLEFDGVTWRRIQTPTKTTIRSLAADASGRIYVGAVGDLGYIEPDEHGETRFVSLLDKLPEDVRVFEDVWRTFAAPEGVYFQTQIGLFRWANGAMKVWKPTGRIFNRAQFANNTLYIGQTGGVLMALKSDVFEPVPGAERMGDEAYPIIIPYDDTHLLMGTRRDGLFLYDGTEMRPFATDVDRAHQGEQSLPSVQPAERLHRAHDHGCRHGDSRPPGPSAGTGRSERRPGQPLGLLPDARPRRRLVAGAGRGAGPRGGAVARSRSSGPSTACVPRPATSGVTTGVSTSRMGRACSTSRRAPPALPNC